MSDSDTEQEPSIEEILTSIRQIISDDDDEEETTAAPPPEKEKEEPAPESEPEEEEEVIELTEKADPEPVEEKADEPEPAPEPEPEPEPEQEEPESEPDIEEDQEEEDQEEEAMEIDMQDAEPEEEPDDEQDDNMADTDPAPTEHDDDALLTRRAEDAAYSGFKQLAAKTAVDTITGVTIEEIVRDELRPMLRVWLDQNLPDIVERLVKEELDKVARRALED